MINLRNPGVHMETANIVALDRHRKLPAEARIALKIEIAPSEWREVSFLPFGDVALWQETPQSIGKILDRAEFLYEGRRLGFRFMHPFVVEHLAACIERARRDWP